MKQFGITMRFLICHNYFSAVAMRDKNSPPRGSQYVRSLRQREAPRVAYTIRSDFFVPDLDPLHMIEVAVTRQRWIEPDFALAPLERAGGENRSCHFESGCVVNQFRI